MLQPDHFYQPGLQSSIPADCEHAIVTTVLYIVILCAIPIYQD